MKTGFSAKIRCYDESQSFLTVSTENLFPGSAELNSVMKVSEGTKTETAQNQLDPKTFLILAQDCSFVQFVFWMTKFTIRSPLVKI